MRRFSPRARLIAILSTACGALYGCAMNSGELQRVADAENVTLGDASERGAWLFWPTSLRVHPLTRVGPTTGDATIDLRLEALDSSGEPTRAVGTFILSVECPTAQPPIERWKIDLSTVAAQAKRFDSVTDTYSFQLLPRWTTPPAQGAKVVVKAVLYGADGATPTAMTELVWQESRTASP